MLHQFCGGGALIPSASQFDIAFPDKLTVDGTVYSGDQDEIEEESEGDQGPNLITAPPVNHAVSSGATVAWESDSLNTIDEYFVHGWRLCYHAQRV